MSNLFLLFCSCNTFVNDSHGCHGGARSHMGGDQHQRCGIPDLDPLPSRHLGHPVPAEFGHQCMVMISTGWHINISYRYRYRYRHVGRYSSRHDWVCSSLDKRIVAGTRSCWELGAISIATLSGSMLARGSLKAAAVGSWQYMIYFSCFPKEDG